MKFIIAIGLLNCTVLCSAQSNTWLDSSLMTKDGTFEIGAHLGYLDLDILSNSNIPVDASMFMAAHVGLNKFILINRICPISSQELSYEFFLFEMMVGYRFNVFRNSYLIPLLGASGGSGTFENNQFNVSRGLSVGVEFQKTLLEKPKHRLLVGLSIDYRNLQYDPTHFFSSPDMLGFTISFKYLFTSSINKNDRVNK